MKTAVRLGLVAVAALLLSGLGADGGSRPARAAFPGENGRIAFHECCKNPSRILTANADGSDVVAITNGTNDQLPEWSPDGLEIAFVSRREGSNAVYVMKADGSGVRRVTGGTQPTWSPDGQRIAFMRDADIWIVNVDGSNEFNFTDDEHFDEFPDWSPDGKAIAYVSGVAELPAGGGQIEGVVTMTTDRERTVLAESEGLLVGDIDWSPDSSKIAYEDVGVGIKVVGATGVASQVLVDGRDPAWSPDGEWIALTQPFGDDDPGISVMPSDGSSEPVQITHGRHNFPDWGVSTAVLHSVEFTQAIQQLQTLGALKADLADDGKPPVPIVAGKPAVMRVYFKTFETGDFTVEVSGAANDEQDVELSEDCTPAQRRERDGNCTSVDFYFTPPAGNWSVTLRVNDEVGLIETHTFNLTSVTTRPMRVVPVDICDRQAVPLIGTWECKYGFNLWPNSDRLRAIFPGDVIFEASAGQIRNDAACPELDLVE